MKPYLDRAEALQSIADTSKEPSVEWTSTQVQVPVCEFCKQALPPTEKYKVYQGKPYHLSCVDHAAGMCIISNDLNGTGMVREEVKSFLTSRGNIKLRSSIAKRVFRPGETMDIVVHISNEANKRINCIAVYLLKIETQMQVISTPHGIERKVIVR